MKIKFEAEVREVKVKKLISLDKEIIIILNTSNIAAFGLANVPSEKTVRVLIEVEVENE